VCSDISTGMLCPLSFFFFFQAEDGIRDRNVTGVQTCALPIYIHHVLHLGGALGYQPGDDHGRPGPQVQGPDRGALEMVYALYNEIGRASCREREQRSGAAAAVQETAGDRKEQRAESESSEL